MISYRPFAAIFVIIFIVASIPFMLGYGFVIDFQKGTHPLGIMLLYMKEGLAYKFIEKALLSLVISLGVQFYLGKIKK